MSITFIWSSPRLNIWSISFQYIYNDLYLLIAKTGLLNFTDDNAITAAEITIQNLISTLETESQVAIEWFK